MLQIDSAEYSRPFLCHYNNTQCVMAYWHRTHLPTDRCSSYLGTLLGHSALPYLEICGTGLWTVDCSGGTR